MASFRKPSTKSRAALAASTAIPTLSADVLEHAGEQAARLAVAAANSDVTTAPDDASTATPAEMPVAFDAAPEGVAAAFEAAVEDVIHSMETPLEPVADVTENIVPPVEVFAEREAAAETIAAPIEPAQTAGADAALDMAETGVDQTETVTTAMIEASSTPVLPLTDALSEIRSKLAEAIRTNLDEAISYWTALMNVRSVPEAMSLNTRHLQRGVDTFAAQSRDMAILVQRAAADAMGPFRPTPTP